MTDKSAPELPHGAYSQIGRRLRPRVTPSHVRQVYLGMRRSPRVERAIANYVKRTVKQLAQNARNNAA